MSQQGRTPVRKGREYKGKNPYEDRVIDRVLALSHESKDYSIAKREWKYTGEVTDHGPIDQQIPKPASCQFCGHPIRYGYLLHNTVTKKQVEVGSECIGNYLDISPALVEADKAAARKKRTTQIKVRRRTLYNEACREVLRVVWTIESLIKHSSDPVVVAAAKRDLAAISPATRNGAMLYSAITDGRVARLADRYGVAINSQKLDSFVREAETIPRDRLISEF